MGPIKTREHHQMSGRAGRRGIDPVGYVTSVVEWPHVRAAEVEKVVQGAIEPIRSQFNLSYATLLTLWQRLGDRIVTAAEKSFANFDPQLRSEKRLQGKISQIRKRLGVLKSLGYLRDGKLTPKGDFARQIQGYELQVSELLHRGVLKQLSEEELCVVFHAVVYEAKKSVWARKHDHGRHKWIRKTVQAVADDVARAEDRADLEDRAKLPDFKLAGAVYAWARGAAWADLEAHTGASGGDLVRFFRLAVQLLRNAYHTLPADDPLREKLRAASRRMNRDVVDAERQLRLGVDLERGAEEEAPAPAPEPGPPLPEPGPEDEPLPSAS
jgi:superfamily II RNA helicase